MDMEITVMNPLRNKMVLLMSVLLLVSALFAGTALAQEPQVPSGFDQLLVYMAAGTFDPNDPDYQAPDGDFWHREIMGRSDDEIAQNRTEAVEFFKTRFGIDPDNDDSVMFQSFMVDPRNEYRAYVVADREVPAEGWVVRDGGWSLAVMNPEGLTLGGDFEGVSVPQGSMMVFGDYNIDTGAEPIIIHYQSGEPIVPQAAGWIAFRCELISEEFGQGLAQGISARVTLENGLVNANIRNVLTFPGLGSN
jgi:hypothetical protein